MNYNSILYRFGLDPNDFINREFEPIKTNDGFIYELWQKDTNRVCPYCSFNKPHIHNRYYIETSATINSQLKETLRIKRIRYKCPNCGKTFTNPIKGLDKNSTISKQVKEMIIRDFFKPLSFETIAKNYNLTESRIIQLFDKNIPFVPRKTLPKCLCIDEKKIKDSDGADKYACVLYDYENRTIVDVIKSRRLAYLDEYFKQIPLKERENVKYFVSDMYDGYATVYRKYFHNASYSIDLFHVVKQLTEAVNSIRTYYMNTTGKASIRYKFMKSKWRLFLCRKEDVPDNFYQNKSTGEVYHYDDLIFDCLKHYDDLRVAYNILQDFYHYYQKKNYDEALLFIEHISNRCKASYNSKLIAVGETFYKWRYGIANTISNATKHDHPNNSVAEGSNNHIELLIRISYGFHNFERFRKRILLIRTYKKP